MNLAAMRAEIQARGFDYVTPTSRIDAWINRAYHKACADEDYPFNEATAVGSAPLTITNLRVIESVVNTTNKTKLIPLDRRNLTDLSTDLAMTGTATYYYVTGGNTVNVYPSDSTASLSVNYWQRESDLTADADTPAFHANYHQSVIVEEALGYAYLDSDNFEAASNCFATAATARSEMADELIGVQHDQPEEYIVQTRPFEGDG